MLQRKARELREASFERPAACEDQGSWRNVQQEQLERSGAKAEQNRHLDQRGQQPHTGQYQEQRRDLSPASLLGMYGMDMKSSFGKQRIEQVEFDRRHSGKKPPLFGLHNESKQSSLPLVERDLMERSKMDAGN